MNACTKNSTKPLVLDARIRDYFNAKLDSIFASSVEESNAASERATRLLWDLPAEQREMVGVLARGFGRAFQ